MQEENKKPEANDIKLVEKLTEGRTAILEQLRKIIIGQDEVINEILIALFARGHCLIVGVPGLAKTLLISSIAQILDLEFNRIQFTPDLMPADITGTDVIEEDMSTGKRQFRFIKGPIFANIVLADEINRTPPKTQSALLQAMQEYQVTAGGNTYSLDLPFFVLATQNPIEQEGTYPLPEAQVDRFMLKLLINYPSREEEFNIMERMVSMAQIPIKAVVKPKDIIEMRKLINDIYMENKIKDYILDLVFATREPDKFKNLH
ncbi:AAA family ATPase, partial [bacterium]|nr:AAA family ATPase [bacterium]